MKIDNPTVIKRDIQCPFCQYEHALLINKEDGMKTGIGFPAYGLRSFISFLYLFIFHIIINGFRLIQITHKKDVSTYIFCPACGNAVSANAPEEIKNESEGSKLYRIKTDKVVTGLSRGIAEFTGIPVLWIRICNIWHAVTGLYFFIAILLSYREDAEAGIPHRKFAKAKKGKWIFGIIKGIANYADIPVVWLRFWLCFWGGVFLISIIVLAIRMRGLPLAAILVILIPILVYVAAGLLCKKKEDDPTVNQNRQNPVQ